MSAPSFLAFYGIRLEVRQHEIEALEERSDARLVAARKYGLKHYWGNFGVPGERWLLFVGANIGIFGVENQSEAQFESEALQRLFIETESKLRQAGFDETPKLYLQWQPEV